MRARRHRFRGTGRARVYLRAGDLLTAAWADEHWTSVLATILNAQGTGLAAESAAPAGGSSVCARQDTLALRFIYLQAPTVQVVVQLEDDCDLARNGTSQASMPPRVIHWLRMAMPNVWIVEG